jgi:hypothetical protein
VVGAFVPGHDCDPELVTADGGLPIEDVLLEQVEEGFHGGVVSAAM